MTKQIHLAPNPDRGAVLPSPEIERDVIYFGSTDGNVYAVSLRVTVRLSGPA